jgi:hypothetical protein
MIETAGVAPGKSASDHQQIAYLSPADIQHLGRLLAGNMLPYLTSRASRLENEQ